MGTSGRSRAAAAWILARNAILIGLLTLLLVELALRGLGFSRAVLYQPDALVGWWGRPGAQGVYLDEGSAEVRISSAGVRDRERSVVKPTDVWRIAVLGDSYTEALQVAEDKRFTSVIERLLAECDAGGGRRVEVLNFGVSGFGTAQEYLLLRGRVLRYAPDVVVLAFLPGNDITDNVRALDPSAASRPYVTLNGSGKLTWDRSFESTRSFRVKSSPLYRALLHASDFSRVVQAAFFVRELWRFKRFAAADREEKEGQIAKAGEPGLSGGIYAPPRTQEGQQAWNVAEQLIEEMNSLTAQTATRFLLVTLSSGIQVHPDLKRSSEAAARHGVADLFYADDRLHAFAAHRGIEVLSLARPLAEYARRHEVFLHGFPAKARTLGTMNLSELGSGHWNERGHQAAGEMIARYLCQQRDLGDNIALRPTGICLGGRADAREKLDCLGAQQSVHDRPFRDRQSRDRRRRGPQVHSRMRPASASVLPLGNAQRASSSGAARAPITSKSPRRRRQRCASRRRGRSR